MTDTAISKHLPPDLQKIAAEYTIPDDFLIEKPDLIELILRSKSLDTHDEKQNWFNLLSLMNDEQVKKLESILLKEKKKLQDIEDKYAKKKDKIREKYEQKRTKEGYINKMNTIKEKEENTQEQDQKEAEDLLDQL